MGFFRNVAFWLMHSSMDGISVSTVKCTVVESDWLFRYVLCNDRVFGPSFAVIVVLDDIVIFAALFSEYTVFESGSPECHVNATDELLYVVFAGLSMDSDEAKAFCGMRSADMRIVSCRMSGGLRETGLEFLELDFAEGHLPLLDKYESLFLFLDVFGFFIKSPSMLC